ncbi:hypothetical protein DD563_08890 [Pelagicola sp. LXJ1103]|nr:hypothetical protein DD563_08890 [Pelagicola sp. LXJ1103]
MRNNRALLRTYREFYTFVNSLQRGMIARQGRLVNPAGKSARLAELLWRACVSCCNQGTGQQDKERA